MNAPTGKIAVVTGAAGGIGRSLAVELARRGAALAISDVNESGLAETAKLCAALGADVKADMLDVSDRAKVLEYAQDVVTHFGAANYLFNNAGVAFSGSVEQARYEDFELVMDVDFWGTVNCTKAFLPYLIDSGSGHIVNISSVLGLFSMPTQSAYSAAKFAVRGFTESLHQEMIIAGKGVNVTCVHPGAVKTDIAKHSAAADDATQEAYRKLFDRNARTSPDSAARSILKGVEAAKPRVLVGLDARLADILIRMSGSTYQRIFSCVGRRSMVT